MTRLGQGGGRKTAIRTANCVVAAAAVLVWGFSQSAFAANPQDAQDAGFNTGAVGPYMSATFLDYSLNSDNDPFGDYTSIRDKGTTATSAAGIFSGPTATAHTTDAGGGTDAFYNASKIFNLGANQQVIFGGMYRYDSSRTTYSSNSPASIGAGNTVNSSTNTFAGLATYRVGDTYLRGGLGGIWGSGTWTNTIGGVSGHSDSDGYVATVALGKVFTLLDTRTAPHSTLPVKAPPKSAAGGYALQLDLSAHLAYASEDIGGFTDQTGFIRGDETLHFGMAGGQARLFATVPDGRVTWISLRGRHGRSAVWIFAHADVSRSTRFCLSWGRGQLRRRADILGWSSRYRGARRQRICPWRAWLLHRKRGISDRWRTSLCEVSVSPMTKASPLGVAHRRCSNRSTRS